MKGSKVIKMYTISYNKVTEQMLVYKLLQLAHSTEVETT